MNLFEKHKKLFNWTLLIAVFIAISYYIVNNIQQLKSSSIQLDWKNLAAAVILTILGHLLSYSIWTRIAMSFDMHTSFRHAGKAWFVSRLARYIPGKVAILLIRFNAYAEHSKTKISAATMMEAYTSICAVCVLLLFITLSVSTSNTSPRYTAAFLLALVLAISHPRLTQLIIQLTQKFLPIPTLHSLPKQKQILGFVTAQLLTMLLHGGALFMTFNAVGQVDPNHYLLITAVFFVAGLIGMLAVFSPSGIGVREAVLFAALANYVDPLTLVVGAILIRLLGIISEISLTGLFVAFDRFAKTPEN